jgi:hypothetical protein
MELEAGNAMKRRNCLIRIALEAVFLAAGFLTVRQQEFFLEK